MLLWLLLLIVPLAVAGELFCAGGSCTSRKGHDSSILLQKVITIHKDQKLNGTGSDDISHQEDTHIHTHIDNEELGAGNGVTPDNLLQADDDSVDATSISLGELKLILSQSTSQESIGATSTFNESHVYLIGNGPISEADHVLIAAMSPDRIYRFNGMNDLKAGEPVGNMFVRSCGNHGFWGLGHCRGDDRERQQYHICPRVAEARQLIAIGKKQDFEKLVRPCGELHADVPLSLASESDTHLLYMNRVVTSKVFSSGFVGLVHVLNKYPSPIQVHIFGMNWNGDWNWHSWHQEDVLVHQMPSPRVIIHKTEGAAYHKNDVCEAANDLQ